GSTTPNTGTFTTVDVTTGYQFLGGAVLGNYLRGNGTNFVSSAISTTDVPWSTPGAIGSASASTGTFTTVDATTGYKVAGGAILGNYLRGDGTNFISSAIPTSDLPWATPGTIGSTTPNAGTFTSIDVLTGYQFAGGAVLGNYLRGNGTNFVSSAISTTDVPWSTPGAIGSTSASTGTFTTVDATTGYKFAGGAVLGNYLRGNGTNFVSSAISTTDIPWSTPGAIGSASASTGTFTTVDATTGYKFAGGAVLGNYLRGDGTNFVSSAISTTDVPWSTPGAIGSTSASTGTFTTVDATTGYKLAGGAVLGNYLRGNGTNFVSSAITTGDVPWSTPGAIGGTTANSATFASASAVPALFAANSSTGSAISVPDLGGDIKLSFSSLPGADAGLTIPDNVSVFEITVGTETVPFTVTMPTAKAGKILFIRNTSGMQANLSTGGFITTLTGAVMISNGTTWFKAQ
ncbi:MAG: hypothetical protein WCT77_08375, partial [Bacteroidota bacterium]